MDFFDLHCDTLTLWQSSGESIFDGDMQVTLKRASAIDKYAQFFAVFIEDDVRGDAAWRYFCRIYRSFQDGLCEFPEKWEQAKTGDDIERIAGEGKLAALLSVEGGAVLGGKLEKLAELQARGVKMMTLTWNGENEIGFGSAAQEKGLKGFGFETVREMERAGMLIDVSHLSNAGLEDVFKAVDSPIVASHSNSAVLCGHRRNLKDEYFKEIVGRGGLVGVNFYKSFLNDDPEKASFADIARHIEHFILCGGENTVCMGSDFDGCETPPGLEHVGKTEGLYTYLLASGFGADILEKIFWKNAHDFVAAHI